MLLFVLFCFLYIFFSQVRMSVALAEDVSSFHFRRHHALVSFFDLFLLQIEERLAVSNWLEC